MRVVRPGFQARVRAVVRLVPYGALTTYGDVAAALGSPRVARHVGWALAALPYGNDVPWHRVINASGQISARDELSRALEQEQRLAHEGILPNARGRYDLATLRHHFDPEAVERVLSPLESDPR